MWSSRTICRSRPQHLDYCPDAGGAGLATTLRLHIWVGLSPRLFAPKSLSLCSSRVRSPNARLYFRSTVLKACLGLFYLEKSAQNLSQNHHPNSTHHASPCCYQLPRPSGDPDSRSVTLGSYWLAKKFHVRALSHVSHSQSLHVAWFDSPQKTKRVDSSPTAQLSYFPSVKPFVHTDPFQLLSAPTTLLSAPA